MSNRQDWVLAGMTAMAFWPTWRWYLYRMIDSSDEPWGLLALATVVILALTQKGGGQNLSEKKSAGWIALSTGLMCCYALGCGHLPNLMLGVIAVSAVCSALVSCGSRLLCSASLWCLLILSLPVIATVQFYAGYPLRVITAKLASWFLAVAGIHVDVTGVVLMRAGEQILVDAPCSGVRMLWSAYYLAFVLSFIRGLRTAWLMAVTAMTFAVLLAGNGLRSAVLVVLETESSSFPVWAHVGVGVVVFALMGLAILKSVIYMEKLQCMCERSVSMQ